jgi:hypothetical protein
MARDAPAAGEERHAPREAHVVDRLHHRRQNEGAPVVARWPQGPEPSGYGPRSPQAVGVSFVGATFSESGYVPPDTMGGVSPTQVLVCINGRIRVFDKAGVVGALNTTTDNFFVSVRAGGLTGDPQVRYDVLTSRWFVLMITLSAPNRFLLAVSNTSTITAQTGFTFYAVQQDLVGALPNADTGMVADYPSLGVDASALYIGCNMFSTTFQGTSLWVVRKSSVLAAGPVVVTALRRVGTATDGIFAPRGVTSDNPAPGMGLFIGPDAGMFSTLDIVRIADPGGSPSIAGMFSMTVPRTGAPQAVEALGSQHPLDALDDRLFVAQAHLDRLTGERTLWTAHHMVVDGQGNAGGGGVVNGSRWYQIGSLTGTPTLVQAGTVFDVAAAQARSYWFPSVAMTGQGHAAIGSSVGGPADFPGVAVCGRWEGDDLGSNEAPTLVLAGAAGYNTAGGSGPSQRWGDFSMTVVDPADDMTAWTFQEFSLVDGSWGVAVVQLLAPPPAAPTQCTPSAVARGFAGVNIVVTGDSVGGMGFFDPGPGFLARIGASVGGEGASSGVVVNSVTWLSPTQLVLNVSVDPAAASGGRSVTIINPDGQTATSEFPILTVTAYSCGSLDFNCDGDAGTDADISDFFSCLAGTCPPPPCASNADFNGDGDIGTDLDIEAFFRMLAGGTCG